MSDKREVGDFDIDDMPEMTPDDAVYARIREENERAHQARLDAMTPAERAAYEVGLAEARARDEALAASIAEMWDDLEAFLLAEGDTPDGQPH